MAALCALVSSLTGCFGGPEKPADASVAWDQPTQPKEAKRDWLGIFFGRSAQQARAATDSSSKAQAASDNRAAQPTFEDAPRDPQPMVPVVFHVEVYLLTLPYGAVSQNTDFWNRLNEQVIDPATYDVLQRNGIRVGEASFTDWEFFKALIEQHPGTVAQAQAVAKESKSIELEMRKDVQFQNVFYFDARNQLIGTTFDRSDNLIRVGFEPTPRKAGWMRLTLAPVVRAYRKRLDYSVANNELVEVSFINPEMFYDCNLRLDVPLESFIVVATSPEAVRTTSIGAAFLTKDGSSQREEQVLIIVPRPFRTDK